MSSKNKFDMNYTTGKNSIVVDSEIGDDTQIWHFCNIYGY